MTSYIKKVLSLFQNKKTRFLFIKVTSLLFFIFLFISKIPTIWDIVVFNVPFYEKIYLTTYYLFDLGSSFTNESLILGLVSSVLGGLNITIAYSYFHNLTKKTTASSSVALFFTIVGVGCATCGTVFVSSMFGLLGLSSATILLPYNGIEFGYLGVIILFISTIFLLKKTMNPNVC